MGTPKNTPFINGKDVTLKMFNDNNPVVIAGKNWTVEQNATEIADGVNGENRDRLDILTNYFSGSVDVYQADAGLMDEIMKQQTNDDAGAAPLTQSASVRKRFRDGSKAAYRCKGMVWGPWTDATPGRTERGMITLKFRFTDWDKV